MALLELKDIGKIYVSEATVAVGIRGVNLSFDRGEFVAITGQSGSGKSTLLNVISGMDSYEEGEMYIEGEETSHYIQADWEKYREKYISFIFQEYNIIDSFTVLENVELALMHIQDKRERRDRAIELLKRVGMEAHLKHKGSHLSGGQKQRTVIARALAKDSPIILADEPTGNLDANTSKEIIELLREVSKDKLLIVVTHNFEEVEGCATREIRVFDGAVESDRKLAEPNIVTEELKPSETETVKHNTVRNSLTLGWSVFKAKPNLSLFLCMLIALAAGAIFFSFASFWSEIRTVFIDDNYMFSNLPGRVVVVRQDGEVLSEEELERLASDTGAEKYIHMDWALDFSSYKNWLQEYQWYEHIGVGNEAVNLTYDKDYGKLDLGRYPEAADEVVLRMPYLMRERYGEDRILVNDYSFRHVLSFKVVGISYYMDSRKQGELLLTKEGFELASALDYIDDRYFPSIVGASENKEDIFHLSIDSSVPVGKFYYSDKRFNSRSDNICIKLTESKNYENVITYELNPDDFEYKESALKSQVSVNSLTLREMINEICDKQYKQGSLFYSGSSAANKAAEALKNKGYVAVPADSTYKTISGFEVIEFVLMGSMFLFMWFMLLLFLAFFIRICTKKSMDAFKSDIAIMRSMGIRVTEIKLATYFRIVICVIPSLIGLPLLGEQLYRTDFGGRNLVYMDATGYLIIFFMLMIVVMRVTIKHVQNLFSENVRKALKGGNE